MKRYSCALCLVLLSILSGCGPSNQVPGGGTVKYDSGEPVPGGTVVFKTDQHQFTGEISSDGTFKLGGIKAGDGLPPGTYKVAVLGLDANDQPFVAAKFAEADKSGLSFEVKKGDKNQFEIQVSKPSPSLPSR